MNRTGSGGFGFFITSGGLLVIAIVVLALIALGGWLLLRH
jgi:hypothetical protein